MCTCFKCLKETIYFPWKKKKSCNICFKFDFSSKICAKYLFLKILVFWWNFIGQHLEFFEKKNIILIISLFVFMFNVKFKKKSISCTIFKSKLLKTDLMFNTWLFTCMSHDRACFFKEIRKYPLNFLQRHWWFDQWLLW